MNLCDTNIWLALTLSGHSHNGSARRWLDTISEPASIIICRATQQSLLRLLTNDTVMRAYGAAPLSNRQAWDTCAAIVDDDRVIFREDEPEALETHWVRFALRDTASPKLWMDAYLAAYALSAGCRMVTTDRAFAQFEKLDLVLVTRS